MNLLWICPEMAEGSTQVINYFYNIDFTPIVGKVIMYLPVLFFAVTITLKPKIYHVKNNRSIEHSRCKPTTQNRRRLNFEEIIVT